MLHIQIHIDRVESKCLKFKNCQKIYQQNMTENTEANVLTETAVEIAAVTPEVPPPKKTFLQQLKEKMMMCFRSNVNEAIDHVDIMATQLQTQLDNKLNEIQAQLNQLSRKMDMVRECVVYSMDK